MGAETPEGKEQYMSFAMAAIQRYAFASIAMQQNGIGLAGGPRPWNCCSLG